MSLFLAGVPGRLKTLADRLTAARAGYLDRIDATVTSLYNTNNWTGAKAGYIDAAISTAGPKPQTALYTQHEESSATMAISNNVHLYPGRYILSGALTANTYATIVNVTSNAGYVYVVAAGGINFTSRTISIKVTIDGTAAIEKTSPTIAATNGGISVIGGARDYSHPFAVRFNTSLKIEVKSSLNETDNIYLKVSYALD